MQYVEITPQVVENNKIKAHIHTYTNYLQLLGGRETKNGKKENIKNINWCQKLSQT